MTTLVEKKEQLIAKVIARLEERLEPSVRSQVIPFTRAYYRQAYADDLLDFAEEDLSGAALAHWNLARRRSPNQPQIRVYNPNFDEHGWQSTHSVVEIVTDDQPFLVDSVIMAINRVGATTHLILHPVHYVERSQEGEMIAILNKEAAEKLSNEADAKSFGTTQVFTESMIHCQVDRQSDSADLAALRREVAHALRDVQVAVEDWHAMQEQMMAVIAQADQASAPEDDASIEEIRAFLRWVVDDHFIFLGYREYRLENRGDETLLLTEPNTGLGVLRDEAQEAYISQSFAELPPQLRALAWLPEFITLSKASAHSTVHRPSHLDYIGIKRYDEHNDVIGERRFLGLYTAQAYSLRPTQIPLLRQKVQRVIERANLPAGGHAYRRLAHILDTFPRDDLFQIQEEQLYTIAMGILQLQERQRLKLFIWVDRYQRFVTCLIYVPRERYNTDLRQRMEAILMEVFKGTSVTFATQFSESRLARVHLHLRTQPGQLPDYSVAELEGLLRDAMSSWEDQLNSALLESQGESRGNTLFRRFCHSFTPAYKADFNPRTAVGDLLRLEHLSDDNPLAMHLYQPPEQPDGPLRFKLYGLHRPRSLSTILPMLEQLGLVVVGAKPYEFPSLKPTPLWIIEFALVTASDIPLLAALTVEGEDHGKAMAHELALEQVKERFQEAFARIWNGEIESDGFNRLVLAARLSWREVVMLRAYSKYLRQILIPFSQEYIQQTLIAHPTITASLVRLFNLRFDPDINNEARQQQVEATAEAITAALQEVKSLDEDRILNRYLEVILATLRTNYFQRDEQGEPKPYLAVKLDPHRISDLPLPRPMFEIYVYGPLMEGVHLRGGPVARGGLRWSDRREDFRTEILGLMKAQMVKNAVIVPVGSKGGFVVKRIVADPRERQHVVERCYKTFIRGMLDLTDNRKDDAIIPPPRCVRYDIDDPYLVVAADKGTATFSDLANAVAGEYDFWLGDAFASGGQHGYDHKKMGITARGAWESVKRHFRELGLDIQNRDDFTVLGIGDMSGDVFGNGMLLSRHIKLVAAFNHLHIFIDPAPDPERSYQERLRLFQRERSSWSDYNPALISSGGGVYSRQAKAITLSPEAQRAFQISAATLTPAELIRQLLKAPVDLLWNGGIGTYIKSSAETHADAGDKTNDALRIDATELQAKVVGEGGNLGLTQRGRIEFSALGGKVLTDAIDNCGGVNCSDHEVNIKIALRQVMESGDMTEKQRNLLLAEMTDEVARLVLRQNYLQPQAISMAAARAAELLDRHARVMRVLEREGKLDRALEALPDDETLRQRRSAGQGLLPPELAVLLCYSKIHLFEALMASEVPEDPYLKSELMVYFPSPIRQRFSDRLESHPLRREIIATYITNSVLNRMGSEFIFEVQEETGAEIADVARAYTIARQIFDARSLWADIESLDNQVPARVQIQMQRITQRLLERASLWLLNRRSDLSNIEAVVEHYSASVTIVAEALPALLQGEDAEALQAELQELQAQQVPLAIAQRVVSLEHLYAVLDITDVAYELNHEVATVAEVYFRLFHQLQLNWLLQAIVDVPTENRWQGRAKEALFSSLYNHLRSLSAAVLQTTEAALTPQERFTAWRDHKRLAIDRYVTLCEELRGSERLDLPMLSVALRELNRMS